MGTSEESGDLPFLKRRESFNRFHDGPMEESITGRIEMTGDIQTSEEIVNLRYWMAPNTEVTFFVTAIENIS